MNDAAAVRVRERVANILEQSHRFLDRQRASARHAFSEIFSFDVPHGHRQHITAIFDREDGDDVGVRKTSCSTSFAQKPFSQL